MQKIEIICLGKLKEAFWRDAVAEYAKRLSAYCTLSITELPEAPLPESPSQKEIDKALETEALQIQKYIRDKAFVIPLCVEGKQLSSEELSVQLAQVPLEGYSSAVFIIGSSHGLSPQIKKKGHLKLSVSKMTFPHQLMRVLLTEQLYRAFTIQAGKKYHK